MPQLVRDGSCAVIGVPEGEVVRLFTAGIKPNPEHGVVLRFDDNAQVFAKAEAALVRCWGEGTYLVAAPAVAVLLTAAGFAQYPAQKRGPTRRRHWCLLLVIGRGYFGCCRETGARSVESWRASGVIDSNVVGLDRARKVGEYVMSLCHRICARA